MPQDPLLKQLAARCRKFSAGTGISLNKMAKMVGVEPTNFSAFVNGRVGLSAKSTIKLMQLLNASKAQLEAKLAVKAVHVEHFQENGKSMTLSYGGSVAGTGPDQNDGTIVDVNKNPARTVPDQAELEFLAGLAGLHQQIIDKITAWQAQKKAKPNKDGVTEGPRKISDNTTSRTPGPKGDLFDTPENLKAQLEFVRKERKKTEELLQLDAELQRERAAYWDARVEAKRKELKAR